MPTRKKSPQTEARPPAPGAADDVKITITPPPPPPPRVSASLSISRVANGFVATLNFNDMLIRNDERERRVARTPAELGQIVAEWAAPTPKKR